MSEQHSEPCSSPLVSLLAPFLPTVAPARIEAIIERYRSDAASPLNAGDADTHFAWKGTKRNVALLLDLSPQAIREDPYVTDRHLSDRDMLQRFHDGDDAAILSVALRLLPTFFICGDLARAEVIVTMPDITGGQATGTAALTRLATLLGALRTSATFHALFDQKATKVLPPVLTLTAPPNVLAVRRGRRGQPATLALRNAQAVRGRHIVLFALAMNSRTTQAKTNLKQEVRSVMTVAIGHNCGRVPRRESETTT